MDARLQESFDRVLGASLDELVETERSLAVEAPEVASSWEIPLGDRDALRRWGLPIMARSEKSVHFKPDAQESLHPELAWDDITAYRLGSYHYRDIGVTQGSGIVVGIPQDRPYPYPFVWLNGSVTAFIDIAWRWTLAIPILMQVEAADEGEELVDNLDRIVDYARLVYRMVANDERFRWWNELYNAW
jgi:hypothetical protein